MVNYLKNSIARKIARRYSKKYSYTIDTFKLKNEGDIEFANWNNPLIEKKDITQEEVNFYKRFIKKGDLCIDIGSNIGDTTVAMAIVAGKEGLSLAFDPNPYLQEVLVVNSKLNTDKTNIIALPYAITQEDGEFHFSSSEASFSNGGIGKDIEEVKEHGKFTLDYKVKGINLEKYLKLNHVDRLDKLSYIKVDAEGYDIVILNSIANLIETYKPTLVVECFTKLSKDERVSLLKFFTDRNYVAFYFDDFIENTKTVELTTENMMSWVNFNFFAYYKPRF